MFGKDNSRPDYLPTALAKVDDNCFEWGMGTIVHRMEEGAGRYSLVIREYITTKVIRLVPGAAPNVDCMVPLNSPAGDLVCQYLRGHMKEAERKLFELLMQ